MILIKNDASSGNIFNKKILITLTENGSFLLALGIHESYLRIEHKKGCFFKYIYSYSTNIVSQILRMVLVYSPAYQMMFIFNSISFLKLMGLFIGNLMLMTGTCINV